MNDALVVALLAGVGGMLGWGAADFFAKKTIDDIGPIKSLVWGHGFGTATFAVIALIQATILGRSVQFPEDANAWLGLLGFGVVQMIVYWLLYMGFEKGQLAVLNPVFASFTGLVALISIIFLGESATLGLIISLAVIFAGIILLNLDIKALRSKKLKVSPGLKEVGAATILAAIWTLGWDKFVGGHDALSYAMYMYAFMTLAAFGLSRIMKTKLQGVPVALWKFLLLIGIGEAIAYLAVSWGYEATNLTSIVALVSGAFSIPTVILAFIFLKERVSNLQAAGILTTIIGIIVVSIV